MKFYVQKDKRKVQNNLAYTPAQMDLMRQQGVPITPQGIADEYIYDGDDNPAFEVAAERQRGVDVAELWQKAETSKKTMKYAKKQKELSQKLTQNE